MYLEVNVWGTLLATKIKHLGEKIGNIVLKVCTPRFSGYAL